MHDDDEPVYYDSEEQAMDLYLMGFTAAEADALETIETRQGKRLVMDFGNIQGWMTRARRGSPVLIWLLLVRTELGAKWRILGATW